MREGQEMIFFFNFYVKIVTILQTNSTARRTSKEAALAEISPMTL
jgi:hypothetical protein